MKALITVGLGFGDEGKGSAVDYLVREHNASLVVRYNGGHQAAHNVVLPDGTHHTFSQFGSGTFAGAKTYLGPNMIVSLENLYHEALVLNDKFFKWHDFTTLLSRVYINEMSLITTPWHMILNKIRAESNNHGSCYKGIGETRKYWLDYGFDAITPRDFGSGYAHIHQKVKLLQQRLLNEAAAMSHVRDTEDVKAMRMIDPKAWITKVSAMLNYCNVINTMPLDDVVVFEGAQGVLLDEHYGFNPHTTWSHTTSEQAFEELPMNAQTTVIGITRPYHTRHGNGPFPTWNKNLGEAYRATEFNVDNKTGPFRYGEFDCTLFDYAIRCDGDVDELFVSCVDHLDNGIMDYVPRYNSAMPKLGDHPSLLHYMNGIPVLGSGVETVPMYKWLPKTSKHIHAVEKGHFIDVIERTAKLPISYYSTGQTYKDKRYFQ